MLFSKYALAATAFAASAYASEEEKRQFAIPSGIIPDEFLPLITAIPQSVLLSIGGEIATLTDPAQIQSYIESITPQLTQYIPPGLLSSVEGAASSLTSQYGSVISSISSVIETAVPSITSTDVETTTVATTIATVTSASNATTGAPTGTNPPAPSGTGAASGTFGKICYSLMALGGVLGVALAL